jgi:hypothetical protein
MPYHTTQNVSNQVIINRLHTYPMRKNERNTEKNTIKYILQQNQYRINTPLKN